MPPAAAQSTTATFPQPRPALTARFQRVAQILSWPQTQLRIYEEILTQTERDSLMSHYRRTGDDSIADVNARAQRQGQRFIDNGFCNLIRLADIRKLDPDKLVVNLGYELGMLGEAERNGLLAHCCAEDRCSHVATISYVQGDLRVNGRLARVVRETRTSTNIHCILLEFQAIQWNEQEIDFSARFDSKKVSDAVTSLNKKLTGIRFFARGTVVRWKLAAPPSS